MADGLFRVDCLLSDGRAVEADGPTHFTAARTPTGTTLLRRKLLAAQGLRVVSVPYYEWPAADSERDAYLERHLAR